MKQHTLILLTAFLLFNLNTNGQKKLDNFRNNSNFSWGVDSLDKSVILYYEKNSYAEKHSKYLKDKIKQNIIKTIQFVGVDKYDKPIHYFVLDNRQRMKLLFGYETNGLALPKYYIVAAIFSEKINSVYSNHELFHLIAMNLWGYSESWINEGMAVYSDNEWHGHELHELSKYLIDNNKFIPLERIARRVRKYDSMITYPLLGSFAKFIEETYGRETTKLIWEYGRKKMKKHIGTSIEELENEWLKMLKTIKYEKIEYLTKKKDAS